MWSQEIVRYSFDEATRSDSPRVSTDAFAICRIQTDSCPDGSTKGPAYAKAKAGIEILDSNSGEENKSLIL